MACPRPGSTRRRRGHGDACRRTGHRRRSDGRVLRTGSDITAELQQPAVDAAVSPVSAHAAVRTAMRPAQRALIRPPGLVMAGRDIGTIIVPEAQLKIWLSASPKSAPAGARRKPARRTERCSGHAAERCPGRVAQGRANGPRRRRRRDPDRRRRAAKRHRPDRRVGPHAASAPRGRSLRESVRTRRTIDSPPVHGCQSTRADGLPLAPGLLIQSVQPGWARSTRRRSGDRLRAIDGLVPRDLIDVQLELPEALSVVVDAAPGHATSRTAGDGQPAGQAGPGRPDARRGRARRHPRVQQPLRVLLHSRPADGLRPSLYVFDDDYRYSFLWGNFLTLTNLDETDWARIGYQRLSP